VFVLTSEYSGADNQLLNILELIISFKIFVLFGTRLEAEMKQQKTPKSESKEAYRLWFEFLKRALAEHRSAVDLKLYSEWGDVESYSFTRWWREIGERITTKPIVNAELLEKGAADDSSYLVRLPKSMTSTQLGTEVRRLLLEIDHQPMKHSKVRLSDGFQIRPFVYRAYLHTYDAQKKLEKLANGGKVQKKDLLIEVRKSYQKRQERYRNNIFRVDVLPDGLFGDFDPRNPEDYDVLRDRQVTANVARYLTEAEKIIKAVKNGRFPK